MSTNFVRVAETKDIQSSNMRPIDLDGERVGIVNVDRSYYAIGNICTHLGGPLNEGKLEGYDVECPWHGSKFDVRTCEPTRPRAQQPVPAYEVKVEENSILVRKHQ
ncbi:MAG: non-heme iron oxygenase ferredoxin subunit [Nitrososphaeraceae archaeon]